MTNYSSGVSAGFSTLDCITAVYGYGDTSHEIRSRACQEYSGSWQIDRISPTTCRCPGYDTLFQSGDIPLSACRKIRVDPSRQDAIDLNIIPSPRNGQVAGQLQNSPLAGTIGGEGPHTKDRGQRTYTYDLSSARFFHGRVDGFSSDKETTQVDFDIFIPLGNRHFLGQLVDTKEMCCNLPYFHSSSQIV